MSRQIVTICLDIFIRQIVGIFQIVRIRWPGHVQNKRKERKSPAREVKQKLAIIPK